MSRRKGWEIGDVDALLSQRVIRNADGSLKTKVSSKIKIEGNITEEQRKELIAEADNCYVTRMVHGDWELSHSEDLVESEEIATL